MNLNLIETQTPPAELWPRPDWPGDFWPLLFDQLPVSLVVFDREGRILLANDEAARRLGLTDLEDFVLPGALKPLRAGAFQLELRGSRSRSVTLPSPVDGQPLTFQLRHLPYGERGLIMAAGQAGGAPVPADGLDETADLARAVGRQVTGPLAGIELYASIVGQELEEAGDSALADLIERIRFGVREVNEYITSFESMAQPLNLNLGSHQLMDIVDEALGALNDLFKERNIGVLVTQKALAVEVDRGLLMQALLNIFLNAVEAMPDGGRIFVEFGTDKAGQLEIVITDTGPGVPVEMMGRVFSPFHTTKNQPLGLGLPVSRRIMQAHQGSMVVGSDGETGGRAVLRLPFLPAGGPAMSSAIN